MVSDVVRAGIGSAATPALGSAVARVRVPAERLPAERPLAERFMPTGEPPLLEHDTLAPDDTADGSRDHRHAWTAYRRAVALEDIRPRAGFAAQLMSQADPGVRAHYEDFSSMISAYTTTEQRPARAAVGSTVSIDL